MDTPQVPSPSTELPQFHFLSQVDLVAKATSTVHDPARDMNNSDELPEPGWCYTAPAKPKPACRWCGDIFVIVRDTRRCVTCDSPPALEETTA